jgi:hypothetical protein
LVAGCGRFRPGRCRLPALPMGVPSDLLVPQVRPSVAAGDDDSSGNDEINRRTSCG